MAVRFLHLADLHLGSRHDYLGEHAARRAHEVLETFRRAIEFALDPDHHVDGILISGNLFDRHRPDSETLSFARGLLGRVVAQKKPVVLIPGFRDSCSYKDSVWRTERWPGIDVITDALPGTPLRRTIHDQDVFFYGSAAQPGISPEEFPGFERLHHDPEAETEAWDGEADLEVGDASEETSEIALEEDVAAEDDAAPRETPALVAARFAGHGIHVGLLCAGIPDHPEAGIRGHIQTVSPATLAASGLDYVALGGYHGFTTYDFDGTLAAYPGTLEGRGFEAGDLGPKSLLVVEVEEGRVEFFRHPISTSRLEESTIDLGAEPITDADALCSALLARASEDVIARIRLEGPVEFTCDLDDIAEKVRPRFRHLEIVDRTDFLGSGLLRRIQGEHTIRGFFVRRMLKRIQDLESRLETAAPSSTAHRDLEVARLALKIGLEQFLEDEGARDVIEAIVPATNGTRPATADIAALHGAHATSNSKGRTRSAPGLEAAAKEEEAGL